MSDVISTHDLATGRSFTNVGEKKSSKLVKSENSSYNRTDSSRSDFERGLKTTKLNTKKRLGSIGDLFSRQTAHSTASGKKATAAAILSKPLKGPTSFYFAVCYLFFAIILFIARLTDWIPTIGIYRIFEITYLAILVINYQRYLNLYEFNDAAVFALMLIPYTLLLFVSHGLCELVLSFYMLWTDIIILQSGFKNPVLMLFIYWLALQIISILHSIILVFTQNNCASINCASLIGGIFENHVNFFIGSFFMNASFLMLSRLIELNASILLEREKLMQTLFAANLDLKRQLRFFDRSKGQATVEAPLETAINTLQQLTTSNMEESMKEQLFSLISILASDKLMLPDLYQNTQDTDVHDWLKEMLLTDTQQEKIQISEAVEEISENAWNLKELDFDVYNFLQNPLRNDFDMLELESLTNGHALYYFGCQMLHHFELGKKLNVSFEVFSKWITTVEKNYRHSNAYHNSTHGADVAHSMMFFISCPKVLSSLSSEEIYACLIAAIVHDYMHPGVNNSYLIATSHQLAIRYNDISVLENFHASSLFEMLLDKEIDIFSSLTNENRKNIRELIIGMVLATDMTSHFDWIGKFKTKLAGGGFALDTKVDKKLCLNVAIKCADLNNITKPLELCRKWTQMVMEEFFSQGDEEKSKGLPISPFMNRETTDIPKCQIGFIDFIVRPLYQAFSQFMGDYITQNLENLKTNEAFWKSCIENPQLFIKLELPKIERSGNPNLLPSNSKTIKTSSSTRRIRTTQRKRISQFGKDHRSYRVPDSNQDNVHDGTTLNIADIAARSSIYSSASSSFFAGVQHLGPQSFLSPRATVNEKATSSIYIFEEGEEDLESDASNTPRPSTNILSRVPLFTKNQFEPTERDR